MRRKLKHFVGPDSFAQSSGGVLGEGFLPSKGGFAPSSGGAAWSPLNLSPAFWGRSDLGVTVTGSGASAWADQSGNARDLTMTTDAQRPPLISADLNGHDVLRFVGGTKQLVWAAPWAQPNEATVILIGRCVTGAAVQQAVSRSGGSGPICYASVTSLRPATYTGSSARADWGSDLTATSPYAVSWSWNISAQWHRVRVNAATAVEDATASSAAVNFADVGATSGGMEWDVAELIIVASALTSEQHASLMTYATARYGL